MQKYLRKKSGFTLSELLIALALLGLIAAFTIPKVLQSVDDRARKARFKEAIAAIHLACYDKFLLGEWEANRYNWLKAKLNPAQVCTDGLAEGCVTSAHPGGTGEQDELAFAFQTAWTLYGISKTVCCDSFSEPDGWYLDINGVALPNVVGEDVIRLEACRFDENGPYYTHNGARQLLVPNGPTSITLYDSLWD